MKNAAPGALDLLDDAELDAKLSAIRADMLDEYMQPHGDPWIVGFSGGKDSTVVTHLVFEMLLALPPSDRSRPIHLVSNDTLVESPLVMGHRLTALATVDVTVARPAQLEVLTGIQ